jgi:hypothetical protein
MLITPPPKELLDLTKFHEIFSRGDISVIMTWLLTDFSPCMVLAPAFLRWENEKITPCIIPLSMAYLWDPSTGDAAHCVDTAARFARALGYVPNMETTHRIVTIIHDHLGDLVLMPLRPTYDQTFAGELTITDKNSDRVIVKEITEDV